MIIRVYTSNPDNVSDRVDRAVSHAQHISGLRKCVQGLGTILFLVPSEHDCGETQSALTARLKMEQISDVQVAGTTGLPWRETLNYGIERAHSSGATHAIILSGKAVNSCTKEVMQNIDNLLSKHTLAVVGVAVDEFKYIVMSGRVLNAFAVWDVKMLREAGGFDAPNGVEEIAPMIRLCRARGACIGVLDGSDSALCIADSPEARKRHQRILLTKRSRQMLESDRMGVSDMENFFKQNIFISC